MKTQAAPATKTAETHVLDDVRATILADALMALATDMLHGRGSRQTMLALTAYVAQMEQGSDCYTASELREMLDHSFRRRLVTMQAVRDVRAYATAWEAAPTYVRSGGR